MKKDEIVVGGIYRGKSGGDRHIIGEGGTSYAHQADTDTVRYLPPDTAGIGKVMTRSSFASWARERIA